MPAGSRVEWIKQDLPLVEAIDAVTRQGGTMPVIGVRGGVTVAEVLARRENWVLPPD